MQELNQRAQGEVTIREALRELDLWGAAAVFSLTDYEDSHKHMLRLIKDWKDLVNQVRAQSREKIKVLLQSRNVGSLTDGGPSCEVYMFDI